jgi:hypothetical protein
MKQRNLWEVIDRLLALLTDEQLTAELTAIKNSALYTAPEVMTMRWNEAANSLNRYAERNAKAARIFAAEE